MQAGDSLNFIKPFSGLEQETAKSPEGVSEEDLAILSRLLSRFINEQEDNIHEFEVLEPHGFVKIFEASYKLRMSDSSYLHVVVFGSRNGESLFDFGVSVNEHLDNGIYNGGYLYQYDKDGLRRTALPPDDPVDDDYDDDDGPDYRKEHFMVSSLYQLREEFSDRKLSNDPDVRTHAEAAERMLQEEMAFEALMEDAGFNNQPPYPGELAKLERLIWDAEPFPLHMLK